MAVFGVDQGAWAYPSGDDLRFGDETAGGANDGYVIPMARFTFYDAFGNSREGFAPTIYIRMPGAFNTSLINTYSPTANIFGTPQPFDADNPIFSSLGQLAETGIAAVQRQLLSSVVGAAGFVGSAGLNARSQIEFLTRKMLNNFNQLIYQGPTYRRFQLPFNMKPTSYQEAKNMSDIIASFKMASSPQTDNQELTLPEPDKSSIGLKDSTPLPDFSRTEKNAAEYDAEAQRLANNYAIQRNDIAALEIGRAQRVLSFGYPDMAKFDIVLTGPAITPTIIFSSDLCVIESVTADYGSGNKMTFFDSNVNEYYPTDVNLALSLQEVTYITAGRARYDYDSFHTIQ